MATEEVKYTIANNEDKAYPNDGSQVDVTFTYDATKPNADGSYTVTGATGTYETLNVSGQVVDTDTITGVGAVGETLPNAGTENDNELFISSNPEKSPIVTTGGIVFTINNAADSNDGKGNVQFADLNGDVAGTKPIDTPQYAEEGHNGNYATGVTETATCFVTGTRIRTARGEIAVQHLTTEDRVVTASGEERPIRWIGHRTIDCRRHPRPELVLPVRIAAHAFGPDRPARDLHVSSGHAICVDLTGEVLIPAGALVNGTTIVREPVDSVTYWHVELDSHDIVLAENMPAESYLEMGNRGFFAEQAVTALHAAADAPARTHADFCRSYQAEGPMVDAVRQRLAARVRELASAKRATRAA